MRKGVTEVHGTVHFDSKIMDDLESKGYKYLQIKRLTGDKHYDYMAPDFW
ncbi:MAG: hypothetical protein ICV81_17765 [Flavisolibacter sp.]|nr:hypothetical protein [Flavisolibacter sp.]MBD0286490.1 hypothetical protein [Flavisolibacter sp.]MBD0349914.1 hypothetical protein [Flavisolibacter sp.]